MIENPGELERLRGDREIMKTAIEEIVRWTRITVQSMRGAPRPMTLSLVRPRYS